ncbi:MAG: hypothetical protein V4689_10320 [Verrucomicrobiota bacterium]
MKTAFAWFTALMAAVVLAQEPDKRFVVVPIGDLIKETPKEAPLFFSVTADVKAQVGLETVTSDQQIDFKIHQGKAETLTLALTGAGDVVSVTGQGLRDWSVRVAEDGSRFLDVRPVIQPDVPLTALQLQVKTHVKTNQGAASLLLPGPGTATGFSLSITATADAGVDLRILKADGLVPVDAGKSNKFLGYGVAALEIAAAKSGYILPDLELLGSSLAGRLSADGNSVSFRLTTTARAKADRSKAELVGGVALSSGVSGDGWHVVLRPEDGGYDLIAERGGDLPVTLEFVAPVKRQGDWRVLDFKLPAGVVVPVRIEGLPDGVSFDRSLAVVPEREGNAWRGFLPANGLAGLAWRSADVVADGALFFSSTEATDVRIGSGLMRQLTTVDLRVLQGSLPELSFSMAGPGEVLAVTGESVLGWSVVVENGNRRLAVKLSRPIEGRSQVIIEAQAALGGFPVQTEALRMVPIGSLRHGGWLRIANDGAVRIDVVEASGLIQLAPAQFPGRIEENPRQLFVYRFPSADYGYAIQANQVLPEVSVTEVTVYELAETDRRVMADIELDIREAPLREWEMEISADHAVASVTGAQVADYAVAGEVKDGKRRLKIIFQQPVMNRQLVSVRLEKNESAKAGAWELQALGFPGVKSRRGYIGAVAAAGYRLEAGKTTGVAEVPVTFFPKKTAGLQQAFRLREGDWQIGLTIKALGQSVQADVFHLYSLKAGAAYGSVLINYFVVGSPATEWKIAVPDGIGNIDVTGQNVGRDWRREGNTVIVPLSRPVLGTGTVLVTFEQPMSARGGDLTPGEVRPLDVQAERGYVQVVSPLQVKFAKPVSEGPLLAIDPTELPAEFRLLSSAPTLAAWQYTARDFKIGMKIEWFNPGETVEQAVDFLKLSSRISRDGEWVTDAGFFVKSRGRSALRTILPNGAALWEAKVNGQAVNARADGGATLIPLPLKTDPNEAVEVYLRYGARGAKAGQVRLGAPKLDAPVIIGEWKVTGDEGRQLVPRGGTAELVGPGLAESVWEWLARNPGPVGGLLLLGVTALILGMGQATGVSRILSLLVGLAFIVVAAGLGLAAANTGRGNAEVLEYAVPVMAAGSDVAVEVGNVAPWLARTGWGMWLVFALGAAVALRGWLARDRWWISCGLALTGAAFLSIRGGAPLFFGVVVLVALAWWLPRTWHVIREKRASKVVEAVVAIIILAAFSPGDARAAEAPKPAESMIHDWQIRDGRLRGTLNVTLRGEVGDRYLLLRAPAVLSGFEGAGLKVVKDRVGEEDAYFIISETAGRATGKAVFEMPLTDPGKGWQLPGGPAAMRQVTLRWDQAGWEFFSPGAARITTLDAPAANESGAVMVLGPADPVSIQARPKQRDVSTEETRFFAEVSNLFLPGPGVVNGRHRVAIRPAQGRVAALVMNVPDGFTVSDVIDGPVGTWRFDPEKRELRVAVEPAQDAAFAFTIETQRGAGTLPLDLELAPLRVAGSAGEIGFLALAFGDEAQPESIQVEGLSRVNPEDFNGTLLPRDNDGNPLVLLQNAFRYGSGEVMAKVRVAAVAPELRAESWQLVSLGDDRLVVSTDLTVTITRSGVFRLALDVPDGLEIETATGEGLSSWTESQIDGKRVVTLHLAGKTTGKRTFNLTMTGRPPGSQENWQVPRLSLREASRETGVLTIVPERGLQVSAKDRRNISQMDPHDLAEAPKDSARAAARPGALIYRLLQSDWALGLSISRLDPWVTAQVFHEATLREGQMLSRVVISYKIENAALKSLRVRIPGLDATAAATVRASGAAVADLVPVEGQPGLWEIRFQRGVAGETSVELEYQRTSKDDGGEVIEPIQLEQVRQQSYFTAIRAGGRLELEAGTLPRGWQRADWAVVQSTLGQAAGNVAPLMAFRVADPEGPLPVVLKRHQLADLQKLRVNEGTLTTLMSPTGEALTAVDLKMHVVGKGTLRLKLPEGSSLFNVLVNDEGATLVREGDEWLFYVFPSPEASRPSAVRFVYSAGTGKGKRLEGPTLNVPMENLTWRVLVPQGWEMTDHGGDFDLKQQAALGSFGLEDYQSFVRVKKDSDSKNAVALLDQANGWLAAGDQEKASNAFSNAVRSNQLDAASGEDARVQLRELKTQQAVLGLNTRRQKLEIDNRSAAGQAGNAQLDRAAEANPVLRGVYNYDPKQFDRFLEGNTADENSALKEIANRIVTQQLAAEPAPVALDVTLPERGTVLTFGRSVQVDGQRPMAITLDLKRSGGGFAWGAVLLCLLVGVMGGPRVSRLASERGGKE